MALEAGFASCGSLADGDADADLVDALRSRGAPLGGAAAAYGVGDLNGAGQAV